MVRVILDPRGSVRCPRSADRLLRRGLTILEVVVVIAITALLLALLIPAVSAARALAQRLDCSTRLRELALATHQYESAYGVYPIGGELRVQLLPYVGEAGLHRDLAPYLPRPLASPITPERNAVLARKVRPYLCPVEPAVILYDASAPASYCGCYGSGIQKYGYDGIFCTAVGDYRTWLPMRVVRHADVSDGLSNTAAFSEILPNDGTTDRIRAVWFFQHSLTQPEEYDDFRKACQNLPRRPELAGMQGSFDYSHGSPWTDGGPGDSLYNHMLEPNSPSCFNGTAVQYGIFSAASLHGGGVNLAYGDGHVAFIADSIDPKVWREMGSRGPSQFLDSVFRNQPQP